MTNPSPPNPILCTEPIPAAGNALCGQKCYSKPTIDGHSTAWICPSHGLEKLVLLEAE